MQGGTAIAQGTAYPNFDLWFSEAFVVPEPSSVVLVLLGGGVLVVLRHLRKARQTQHSMKS